MFRLQAHTRFGQSRRVVGTIGAVLLGLLVTGCSGGAAKPPVSEPDLTPSIAGVQTFTNLSHEHIAGPVRYPQHPPVGGPHWPPRTKDVLGWQACAAYDAPVVDEFAVHSLEHGAVWLSYRPDLPADQVATLRSLIGIRPEHVLVSPYPGQAAPVVATAWGLQLAVDSGSDPRLIEFTRSFAGGGQGGELGADCAHGATLTQARVARAAAR